jgi:serine/threonine protein phosphatase PrpC
MNPTDINPIIKKTENFDDVAKKVVKYALEHDSNDNTTSIIIEIL